MSHSASTTVRHEGGAEHGEENKEPRITTEPVKARQGGRPRTMVIVLLASVTLAVIGGAVLLAIY